MLKLANLFSKGAVLQRRKTVPVWGWSTPDSHIECEFNGIKRRTGSSCGTGKFMLRFPAMEAGGPFTLTVRNLETGESVSSEDILVGEVWLASGQSNMEFHLATSCDQHEEYNRENTPSEAENIRTINVVKSALAIEQDDCEGVWLRSTNENTGAFSAVSIWFAKKLRRELGVPVGIVHSSCGGTIAEAWTSRETLRLNPATADAVFFNDDAYGNPEKWEKTDLVRRGVVSIDIDAFYNEFCTRDPGGNAVSGGWAEPGFDDSAWGSMIIPGDWINQKLGGHGAAWVRREITLPPEYAGKDLVFHFCVIDKHDTVFFNGERIGATGKDFEYHGTLREYSVPGRLVRPGGNVIAIRVYSFVFGAGFYGTEYQCRLESAGAEKNETSISLAGEWKFKMEFPVSEPPSLGNSNTAQGPGNPNSYSILFDGMIRPLLPYAVAGAFWYQGESNADTIADASTYFRKMTDMIRDWRFHWGQRAFPFLMVGLAGYRDAEEYNAKSAWAVLREAQRKTSLELPDVHIASAVDRGNVTDIHPQDKRTVGTRLALQALGHVYGMDIVPCGPVFLRAANEGKTLRLFFARAEGLRAEGGSGRIAGFVIAGANGMFHPAEAAIEGSEIVLSSPGVELPLHVRYGWSDNPVANLYNGAGLPAFPFEA